MQVCGKALNINLIDRDRCLISHIPLRPQYMYANNQTITNRQLATTKLFGILTLKVIVFTIYKCKCVLIVFIVWLLDHNDASFTQLERPVVSYNVNLVWFRLILIDLIYLIHWKMLNVDTVCQMKFCL